MYEYFIKFLWLAGIVAALWLAHRGAKLHYYDKLSFTKGGVRQSFDATLWAKWFPRAAGLILVLTFGILLVACSPSNPPPPPVAAISCQGSYAGGYSPPDHDERIRLRNLSLAGRGITVTADEAENNRNAGGGDPDGGIYMVGSFTFETDANCIITKGTTMVFHAYEYNLSGSINKDGTFKLLWSGQGSEGEMAGKIEANNAITGKFFHPAPDSFVYGVLSGTFVPVVK